mmetsp:Transcript_35719/g.59597  ORF Transcript_35719/g.59597 Transcript_35719/m.59597 type:complete len:128 (-) Transcript_35719:1080-1463(-)
MTSACLRKMPFEPNCFLSSISAQKLIFDRMWIGAQRREYLLPYLLADRIDTKRFTRRVYMDLGAAHWTSSTLWHIKNNPVKFAESSATPTGQPPTAIPGRKGTPLRPFEKRIRREGIAATENPTQTA